MVTKLGTINNILAGEYEFESGFGKKRLIFLEQKATFLFVFKLHKLMKGPTELFTRLSIGTNTSTHTINSLPSNQNHRQRV